MGCVDHCILVDHININNVLKEEYRDGSGVITGLGYVYRESLEISLGRLFSVLSLNSGKN